MMPDMSILGLVLSSCLLFTSQGNGGDRHTAADDSVKKPLLVHHLGVTTGFDYMASSVEDEIRGDVEDKISVHTAIPLHLKYSFSFTNPKVPHYLPGGY